MKRFLVPALAASVLMLAHPARACVCVAQTVAEHLAAATAVFTATAQRVEIGADETTTTFVVHAVYKGDVTGTLALTLPGGREAPGNTCETEFVAGERYLVLAGGEDGRLETDICSGTTQDAAVIAELGDPLRTYERSHPVASSSSDGSRAGPIAASVLLLSVVGGGLVTRARRLRAGGARSGGLQ